VVRSGWRLGGGGDLVVLVEIFGFVRDKLRHLCRGRGPVIVNVVQLVEVIDRVCVELVEFVDVKLNLAGAGRRRVNLDKPARGSASSSKP
jgi:hypothetical protein